MKEFEPVIVRTMRGTSFANQPCDPHTEAEKQIDWNNSSDRKWLMSHLHWAMLNGRGIQLFAQNRAPHTIA